MGIKSMEELILQAEVDWKEMSEKAKQQLSGVKIYKRHFIADALRDNGYIHKSESLEKIQIEAWQEAFGTTQLTHALARLEEAEKRVKIHKSVLVEARINMCKEILTLVDGCNNDGIENINSELVEDILSQLEKELINQKGSL